jgi:hypothetical protein
MRPPSSMLVSTLIVLVLVTRMVTGLEPQSNVMLPPAARAVPDCVLVARPEIHAAAGSPSTGLAWRSSAKEACLLCAGPWQTGDRYVREGAYGTSNTRPAGPRLVQGVPYRGPSSPWLLTLASAKDRKDTGAGNGEAGREPPRGGAPVSAAPTIAWAGGAYRRAARGDCGRPRTRGHHRAGHPVRRDPAGVVTAAATLRRVLPRFFPNTRPGNGLFTGMI